MAQVDRIDVETARQHVQAGRALLVCAYGDAAKCRQMNLEGAIGLEELRARLPSLPRDQEIVFYCG